MTSITIPLPYTCLLQHISLGISRKFNESNVYDWLVVVIKMCIVSLRKPSFQWQCLCAV